MSEDLSQRRFDLVSTAIVVMAGLVALAFYVYMAMEVVPEQEGQVVDIDLFEALHSVGGGTSLNGRLNCGELGVYPAFSRRRALEVTERGVIMTRGQVEPFLSVVKENGRIPREFSSPFEVWIGDVDGENVALQGWYVEGSGQVREIAMIGSFREGGLYLDGNRGPRDCTFSSE